ncbi:hypothetical protein SASPL_143168 [Salvia splendens]|uniref:SHSP domain-containing protein n=1 Tax=Salvia splendens TaxID=180675 RepID=A0A8X8ZA46_SALSN|nr:hypothetical protein SASPL_143168 [Salvia splendens]
MTTTISASVRSSGGGCVFCSVAAAASNAALPRVSLEALVKWAFLSPTTSLANDRIDWNETPEAHLLKVDVRGLKKEEVKVEVEDGSILQINGERSKEHEEKNDTWHRVERRFRQPENAKLEQVKAAMEDGVLTVTVPKEEVKKPQR